MKRTIVILVSLCMLFSFVGCGNDSVQSVSKNESELYAKAMEILNEFKEQEEVQDFLVAYDLLMNLPDDEDGFIKQLGEVNDIYSKYGVELHYGDYYLGKPGTFAISAESIKEYKSKSVYHDVKDLLNAIIYPVLFDKYGDSAYCIDGITYQEVISAIRSTNDYVFDAKEAQFDSCTETWKYVGIHNSEYEVKYHPNGLVESIDIPIVRSENLFSDDDYVTFLENDIESQKKIAGNRFMDMHNQFSTIFTGYEVLSHIFNDEEIEIISNYIHSLTTDDIWERNFWAYEGEPTTYATACVIFDYNGKHISIHYGLNDITLKITGNNDINKLSHKWYTVWLGLCDKGYSEETVGLWSSYIENDVASNDTVHEWSYDLGTNADKFATATIPNVSPSEVENTIESECYIEVFTPETAIFEGTIARTNESFPTFCLILDNETKITLKEMDISQEYTCVKLYFYEDADVNGGYDYASLVGKRFSVIAQIEDYRGAGQLFLCNPVITELN